MSTRYRTEARNVDGGTGVSRVPGGLEVSVDSPLREGFDDAAATNPEQLLALAWATCLNATAQAIVRAERRTAVRVEVELRDAASGGYEFVPTAILSAEGLSDEETGKLLALAHARCPVSRLLQNAATATVRSEPWGGCG